jgi:hypothetical protein
MQDARRNEEKPPPERDGESLGDGERGRLYASRSRCSKKPGRSEIALGDRPGNGVTDASAPMSLPRVTDAPAQQTPPSGLAAGLGTV